MDLAVNQIILTNELALIADEELRMSRLIIKNLPFSITEQKLRNTFAKHGNITDLQLKYKDGKFRGFAFIGYTSDSEASAAKQYLDNTYVGAAKIKVEFCDELGKSSATKKSDNKDEKKTPEVKKEETTNPELEKYKDDPKFKEFMNAHGKNNVWGNNNDEFEAKTGETVNDNDDEDEAEDENSDSKPVSDLDYLKTKKKAPEKSVKPKKDFFTVKLTGLPYKCKKRDLKAFIAPLKPASVRMPAKIKGFAFLGFITEKEMKTALNKNKSFMDNHQISVFKHIDTKKSAEAAESMYSKQEAGLEGVETVGESGRIFIRNLAYCVTEEDISDLFSEFGPLTETTVPVDKNTRKYKGFAFVTFMLPEHAVKVR